VFWSNQTTTKKQKGKTKENSKFKRKLQKENGKKKMQKEYELITMNNPGVQL
tara:strand:+ start:3107 stop:3262 length:156 start_codon:yes stop_codon:yes gene_type:complete